MQRVLASLRRRALAGSTHQAGLRLGEFLPLREENAASFRQPRCGCLPGSPLA